MTKQNDGGRAFPQVSEFDQNGNALEPGMSLRDYFAGQVMQGFWSGASTDPACRREFFDDPKHTRVMLSRAVYKEADAMLAAREEE